MSMRALTVVLLRLMAIWFGFTAILHIESMLYSLQMGMSFGSLAPITASLAGSQLLVGAILFALSKTIAGWVFSEAEMDRTVDSIRPGDLYHVAAFVAGTLIVAKGFRPMAVGIATLIGNGRLIGTPIVGQLLHGACLLLFGAGLMLGARGIGGFFALLGHDPDNIPAQQFGIRAILVIVVICAVLLLATRSLLS